MRAQAFSPQTVFSPVTFVMAALLCGAMALGWGFFSTDLRPLVRLSDASQLNLAWTAAASLITALALAAIFRQRFAMALLGVFAIALVVGFGIGPTFTVALLALACLSLGDVIGGTRWRAELPALEAGVLAFLGGLAALVLALNISVHFPVNNHAVYGGAVVAMILANLKGLGWYGRQLLGWIRAEHPRRWFDGLLAAPLLLIFLVHAVNAALPERYYDSQAIHLYVASMMANVGRWPFDIRNYLWADFPMAGDFAYAAAYVLSGEAAAKLLNFSLFLATVALLFAVLRRQVGARLSLLLCGLFAATPLAFIETATLFVENILMAFMLGAFVAIDRLLEGRSARHVLVAALCLAGAVAAKLHGVLFAAPAAAIVLVWAARGPREERRWLYVTAGLVIGVFGCVPYIYAYATTGNPIFPLFNAVFKSPDYPLHNFSDARFAGELGLETLFRLTFHSQRYFEGWPGAFGFQTLGFALAALAAAVARPSRPVLLAAGLGGLYCCGVLLNMAYIRYLYPALPLATVLIAGVFQVAKGRRGPTMILGAFAVVLLAANMLFFNTAGWILQYFDPLAPLSDQRTRAAVMRDAPQRVLIDALNAGPLPNPRVLFLGSPLGATLKGTALYPNWYNPDLLKALRDAPTDEAVRAVMAAYKVTNVILFPDPGVSPRVVSAVLRSGRLVMRARNVDLYALDDESWLGREMVPQSQRPAALPASATGGAKPEPMGGLHIAAGTTRSEGLLGKVVPFTLYRAKIAVDCGGQSEEMFIQMNWSGPAGVYLGGERKSDRCRTHGDDVLTADFIAPAQARTATLSLIAGPKAAVEVLRSSVREGYSTRPSAR